MKKILFIIQSYPSFRSANVVCDEKIMKSLLATGQYEISCLVYKYYGELYFEEINGIKVHRFHRSLFWELFTWARGHEQYKISQTIQKLNRILMRIKQVLFILIYPCYEPFVERKYAKEAINLCRKEHFDLVISEYNGFDTLFAGYSVKKIFPNIKFIPILWDPLTGKEPAKYLPKKFAERKIYKSEARLLGNADTIIAMEASRMYHRQNSMQKSYYEKFCFLDIPGIIKPDSTSADPLFIEKNKINIVFTGVLSFPERNPTYIVNLFNKLQNAADIHLIFLCVGSAKAILCDLNSRFKGTMVIHDYISREELNAVYQNADMLLNIGGSNPFMVPSKIFEYMSYGKPIISTYYIDSESSKNYLRRYPLSLCIDERISIDDTIQDLEEFLYATKNKKLDFEEVKKEFKENTPKAYTEVIGNMLLGGETYE